jgi:glycosyltransferase involved in cell wall biosynthesis
MNPLTVWMLDPAQLTPYYNIALCDGLAQAGCRVRYITSTYLYDDDLPFTGQFETDYLYFRGLNHPALKRYSHLRRILRGISYPLGHWQLARALRRTPPDMLHIQWSRLPRFDRWLVQQAQAAGVPVVHTVHDVRPLYAPESVPALRTVYEEVDALILHTQANRTEFLQCYPTVKPDHVQVIPLIASPYTAMPPDASRAVARQRLGLPADAPVVLFFGAIRHYKGLDILLTAFEQAVASNAELHLLIAGAPESDADRALLERARQQRNIHVASGYIPYEDVWQYYLSADAVVFPYRVISQSGALLTTMGFGQAVIVTRVSGLPESVEGNGWVVPAEDPAALASAILDATSDLERLHRMGMRSAELVRTKYAPAIIAGQTLEMYHRVLNGR